MAPIKTTLELPAFTICAKPFINETALHELGLDESVWSMYNQAYGINFSTWPIKDPVKDRDLFERTTFGMSDLFLGRIVFLNNFKSIIMCKFYWPKFAYKYS